MKKIMILGADKYSESCIASARASGFYVICLDRNPQALAQRSCDAFYALDFSDLKGTLELAKALRIDGIVPLNDWGVPTAAFVAEALGLPGVSRNTASLLTDKLRMRETWAGQGIASPEYALVGSATEAARAGSRLGYPVIFKPVESRGGGSRGVRRVDGPEQVEPAYAFATSFYADQRVLVEQYLEGLEHSLEILVVDGQPQIIAISDKVKTPPPYRVDKEVVYPTSLDGERLRTLHSAASQCVRGLGVNTGAVHLEMCSLPDGRHVPFEAGGRCGGGRTADPVVRYAYGVDVFAALCALLSNAPVADCTPRLQRDCVYHFITPVPGVITAINLAPLTEDPRVLDYGVYVSVGETVRPIRFGLDRCGFVVYQGRTFDSDQVVRTI